MSNLLIIGAALLSFVGGVAVGVIGYFSGKIWAWLFSLFLVGWAISPGGM